MKTFTILLLASFACLPVYANVPKKEPLVKYTGLWTDSPFTSKKPIVGPGPTVNPFEDYTLTGIAPVPGGYRITIISKKNPELKKVIEPGKKSEFKVVSVNRNPEKSLGTTVVLSSGAIQGTVSFEPDLLTLKAAPPVAPTPPPTAPPTAPPGVVDPNQPPPPPQAPQRQPRPRIAPPATPAAQPQLQQPPTQGGAPGQGTRRDDRRR